jgi:hypothetical protein
MLHPICLVLLTAESVALIDVRAISVRAENVVPTTAAPINVLVATQSVISAIKNINKMHIKIN